MNLLYFFQVSIISFPISENGKEFFDAYCFLFFFLFKIISLIISGVNVWMAYVYIWTLCYLVFGDPAFLNEILMIFFLSKLVTLSQQNCSWMWKKQIDFHCFWYLFNFPADFFIREKNKKIRSDWYILLEQNIWSKWNSKKASFASFFFF